MLCKLSFFFDKSHFLLFQRCFFGSNLCFQLNSFIGFDFLLFIQFFIGKVKSFQCCFCQFNTDFTVIFFYLVVFLCFFRLAFQ